MQLNFQAQGDGRYFGSIPDFRNMLGLLAWRAWEWWGPLRGGDGGRKRRSDVEFYQISFTTGSVRLRPRGGETMVATAGGSAQGTRNGSVICGDESHAGSGK